LQEKAIFAAIGPVTARSLRDAGVERIVSAADTTASAVVWALEQFFTGAKQVLAGVKRR
jgi:uroporphyrinogen-III synthase